MTSLFFYILNCTKLVSKNIHRNHLHQYHYQKRIWPFRSTYWKVNKNTLYVKFVNKVGAFVQPRTHRKDSFSWNFTKEKFTRCLLKVPVSIKTEKGQLMKTCFYYFFPYICKLVEWKGLRKLSGERLVERKSHFLEV